MRPGKTGTLAAVVLCVATALWWWHSPEPTQVAPGTPPPAVKSPDADPVPPDSPEVLRAEESTEPDCRRLRVRALDEQGHPIPGVGVRVGDRAETLLGSTTRSSAEGVTDGAGWTELAIPERAKSLWLLASGDGFVPQRLALRSWLESAPDPVQVEVTLGRPRDVLVHVTDETGKPVSGALVAAEAAWASDARRRNAACARPAFLFSEARSDGLGAAWLEVGREARYRLHVSCDGYWPRATSLEAARGKSDRAEVVLQTVLVAGFDVHGVPAHCVRWSAHDATPESVRRNAWARDHPPSALLLEQGLGVSGIRWFFAAPDENQPDARVEGEWTFSGLGDAVTVTAFYRPIAEFTRHDVIPIRLQSRVEHPATLYVQFLDPEGQARAPTGRWYLRTVSSSSLTPDGRPSLVLSGARGSAPSATSASGQDSKGPRHFFLETYCHEPLAVAASEGLLVWQPLPPGRFQLAADSLAPPAGGWLTVDLAPGETRRIECTEPASAR